MEIQMNDNSIVEMLETIFSNVNSWLNFAEAKNAANIAFVIACIAAIFSLQNMNIILYIVCIFLIASGIGSLISFLPRLGNKVNKNCFTLFKKNPAEGCMACLSDFFPDAVVLVNEYMDILKIGVIIGVRKM